VSPLELVDDRFDKLAEELRASRPVAPPPLRTQVRALEPPPPRWTFRKPSRRVVLALAGAALLASFLAAGLTRTSPSTSRSSGAEGFHPTAVPRSTAVPAHGASEPYSSAGALRAAKGALGPATIAPSAGRLQRYDATLRLRVKDVDALSTATRRAIDMTRRLGGYVGSVQYATRGGERGGATLVLRVPVASVQSELASLSSLGTILQQHTGILDVTRRVDREARQIAQLERRLAEASPAEAPAIRAKLATLRAKHARLLKSARLARITLALTTPAKQAAVAPSRLDRTLDDAGSVLVRELQILLYALVVAGPLLLLGAVGIATARIQRRRADARLLERA
jgi:hypothetical protein